MHIRQLFALSFFVCQIAIGQPLYFKHLSVNNGLSQAVNNCVFRDSKGFIWISSFDGLNKFDGITCRIFRTGLPGSEGLKGTLFLNILEDKAGNLWIGSNEGLNMYNRRENRFYNFSDSSRTYEQFYSPLYIDSDQSVWVQSGFEIFRFSLSSHKFQPIAAPFKSVGLLVKTSAGKQGLHALYAIHQSRPVLYRGRINGKQVSWDSLVLQNITSPITTISVDDTSHIWIGSKNGLYELGNNAVQLMTPTANFHITALQPGLAGKLWIGTQENGLLQFDTYSKQLLQEHHYSAFDNQSIAGNQVRYLCADNMQNLWVSVWGKGVDYTNLARFRFKHFITREEANLHHTDNFIKTIIQVGNNSWCGTQSGGIIILDSSQRIIGTIQNGMPASSEHLLPFQHEVYAATIDGVFAISLQQHSIRRITAAGQQFNYITAVSDDELLLSANHGLFLYQTKTNRLKAIKGFTDEVYLTCFSNSNGDIYIGRPYKGFLIARLLHDSLIIKKNIALEATVKCYYKANDSTIWIGSTQGLIAFNPLSQQVKKIYNTVDGISNQYIYGVVPDGNFLWLSTNAGINRFHIPYHKVKSYNVNDGLQSNEFNTYAFGKTNTGIIQFGGINGINAFDPSSITQFDSPPQLQLTDVQVNDKKLANGINPEVLSNLSLGYNENTISLQFTALHYDEPLANGIQYKLVGYDKRWISTGNKNYIRYTKLPANDYTLLVKATNASGQSSVVFQLPITIRTPWWQTWWFRLLIVIATTITILLAVKIYTRQRLMHQRQILEKELAVEQERTRVARDLHDGLGGMLSGIKHAVAALQLNVEHDATYPALLSKTLGMLDESILELRRVAYSMTPPSLSQFGLDHALRDYCSSVSGAENLQLIYQSIGAEKLVMEETKSLALYRIVQELVNNIIKHANATEALVQLSVVGDKLSITVEDNGVGFDAKKALHGNGMGWKNIHSRVESLPAMIDLQSVPGKGCSVYIEMKIA